MNKNCPNFNNENYFFPIQSNFFRAEIKKSIFIANLANINSKLEASSFINNIKNKYSSANHNCWAYILGNPVNPSKVSINDDGEPSGSAGRPIINVLNQKRVGDVIVTITRYFGGIKLGIGGLIRTYSKMTSNVLNKTTLKKYCLSKKIKIKISYSYSDFILYFTNKMKIPISSIEYKDLVTFNLLIERSQQSNFFNVIKDKTNGKVIFDETD